MIKKLFKNSVIISILTILYVVFIHVFVNRNDVKGHLLTNYLLFHFLGVIPCVIMAVRVITYVEEIVWKKFLNIYNNTKSIFNYLIFFIYICLFGIGKFGAGIIPLLIMILIGLGPTMIGILIGNIILGNGFIFKI